MNRVLALALIALAACSAPSPAPFIAAPAVVRVEPQVDIDPDKALFFARLKQVSDTGDLFDPGSLAPLLGMELRSSTSPQKINADCSLSYGFSAVTKTTVTASGKSWYRVLPSGRGQMQVPAFTINGPSTTPDAALDYQIDRYLRCRDTGSGLVDSTQATLTFDGLPSFACVSADDIRRLLPAAQFIQATDGVSLFRYRGRVDNDVGTSTDFVFRAGVPCVLAATIKQQQTWGWRYLHADLVYQTCRVEADQKFCAAHREIVWPDATALQELIRTSDAICGSPDAIYRASGTVTIEPPAAPRSRNWSRPC